MKNPPCVPELLFPGCNILARDVHVASRFRTYLGLLEGQLETAAATLMMFEETVSDRWSSDPSSPGYSERRDEILKESTSGSTPPDASQYLRIRFEAEVQAKKERWASGSFPEQWRNALVKAYAREFIYALDNVKNLLGRLAGEPDAPIAIDSVKADFMTAIPFLKGVRDSLHHIEDRGLGRDRNGQPIHSEPITSGTIQTGGGGMLIEALVESNFGITADTGQFAQVAISRLSLGAAQVAIQRAIDVFQWSGPPRHYPR